jgi:hypothetical protein
MECGQQGQGHFGNSSRRITRISELHSSSFHACWQRSPWPVLPLPSPSSWGSGTGVRAAFRTSARWRHHPRPRHSCLASPALAVPASVGAGSLPATAERPEQGNLIRDRLCLDGWCSLELSGFMVSPAGFFCLRADQGCSRLLEEPGFSGAWQIFTTIDRRGERRVHFSDIAPTCMVESQRKSTHGLAGRLSQLQVRTDIGRLPLAADLDIGLVDPPTAPHWATGCFRGRKTGRYGQHLRWPGVNRGGVEGGLGAGTPFSRQSNFRAPARAAPQDAR